jgi:hypothetical protein
LAATIAKVCSSGAGDSVTFHAFGRSTAQNRQPVLAFAITAI